MGHNGAPGAGVIETYMLDPLVVALGLLLYKSTSLIWMDLGTISLSALCASCFGLFLPPLLARALGLPRQMCMAAATRFITIPLAVLVSPKLGAHEDQRSLAVLFIVCSGLLGATLGRLVMNRFANEKVRGYSIGGSSHVLGIMSLAVDDRKALPYGTAIFILNGVFGVILLSIPPISDAVVN